MRGRTQGCVGSQGQRWSGGSSKPAMESCDAGVEGRGGSRLWAEGLGPEGGSAEPCDAGVEGRGGSMSWAEGLGARGRRCSGSVVEHCDVNDGGVWVKQRRGAQLSPNEDEVHKREERNIRQREYHARRKVEETNSQREGPILGEANETLYDNALFEPTHPTIDDEGPSARPPGFEG
ncbi:hypothetical protein GUJ93_ZPchr0004g39629 [Zizania palustris]|uniref:Uncharacterized protein n=1 Tax=Zizania palustris TaxID=103762 RepID=A0A8J5VNL6_ZIZPA|nr:hypothetical protein GUJ93_ZPchr0004g39629 [Zizania palustris]